MNSRRKYKGPETKEKLLSAALKLFLEKGFDNTTMRDISAECGMSLGSTYYHFKSKDEIILKFYLDISETAQKQTPQILQQTRDFRSRVTSIIQNRLEHLSPYRSLVKVLSRNGSDFSNPLSPLSSESEHMRNNAISLFNDAISGSTLRCNKNLISFIPTMLWLYELAIIIFWTNDKSSNQKHTHTLIHVSMDLIEKLLLISTIPLSGSVNKLFSKTAAIILASFDNTNKQQET
jgi:AcrR family transcriptional regulator